MNIATFQRKLTACLLGLLLAGCASQPVQTEFDRSEAVKARVNLALAYLEQHDFPKARENIDKALAHNEKDYLPHSVLAYYYQLVGEVENATNAYDKALSLSQSHPDVLNNYGTFLCKQGNFDEAYRQFETALESKQPYYHQADTLENIALCAYSTKHHEKQHDAMRRLEKLSPEKAQQLRQKLK